MVVILAPIAVMVLGAVMAASLLRPPQIPMTYAVPPTAPPSATTGMGTTQSVSPR
ncbi:MAG: hypothetical protein U0269_31160 [Polyangiales bacterium]